MQYILTEEEYMNLVPKWKLNDIYRQLVELQKIVMEVTNHKCIYDSNGDFMYSYCDNCPLAHFDCGKRKEFSK